MDEATLSVHCPCGAVEIELIGEPMAQFFCHCDDCQMVHGAAYVPEVMFRAEKVVIKRGDTFTWKLKTTPRFTCARCGTRLFADVTHYGIRGVNGFLLPRSGRDRFKPQFHIQCKFAVNPVRDDLPHYESVPTIFGGSGDERVEW